MHFQASNLKILKTDESWLKLSNVQEAVWAAALISCILEVQKYGIY